MVTALVGVSMPRSGHHYLARLLRDALGGRLRYCEFYTPLQCCRRIPCARPWTGWVYQKNHDLDLQLDPGLDSCLYIIQTREPLGEALSDRELLETVRPELRGDEDHLLVWLGAKAAYRELFLDKWVTRPPSLSVHVDYARLRDDPVAALNEILDKAGCAVDRADLARTVSRQMGRGDEASPGRFLSRDTGTPGNWHPGFDAFVALLSAGWATGGNDSVYEAIRISRQAQRADLLGQHDDALQAWRLFVETFPGNPHGLLGLSVAWSRRGDSGNALSCALAATRLLPVRPDTLKRARDLLQQAGRHAEALEFSRILYRTWPDRPGACIDFAVDLHHSGLTEEAVTAAEQFLAASASMPLEAGCSSRVWSLRCGHYGYNQPAFFEVAAHVLTAGGRFEGASWAVDCAVNDLGLTPSLANLRAHLDQCSRDR